LRINGIKNIVERTDKKMRNLVTCILVTFFLSGCADTIRGNLDKLFSEENNGKRALTETVYCYRTIGEVNCYAQPLPGQEANRLVGYEGASPRSTAATGPLRP